MPSTPTAVESSKHQLQVVQCGGQCCWPIGAVVSWQAAQRGVGWEGGGGHGVLVGEGERLHSGRTLWTQEGGMLATGGVGGSGSAEGGISGIPNAAA